MKTLAVETSWEKGSVALLEERKTVREQFLDQPHAHGRTLAPTVLKVLKQQSWTAEDLDLICVNRGPGSYTGLRVGVSFVKTFAYSEDLPVTAVSSCDAIALRAPANDERLCVVINAEWNEVYTARFRREEDQWVRSSEDEVVSPEELMEHLDEETLLLGNGISSFREQFDRSEATFGPESSWYPEASAVGEIGYERFQEGETEDLASLQPLYLRPTQADVDRN